jgi:mannose-6-phosphate isomerase class I
MEGTFQEKKAKAREAINKIDEIENIFKDIKKLEKNYLREIDLAAGNLLWVKAYLIGYLEQIRYQDDK